MLYNTIADLPPDVRDALSADEQTRWLTIFNTVFTQTHDDEKASLAAWGAVRKGRTTSAARSMTVQQDGDLVIVKGWGMKFTGPWDPDLYGEHFSTLTSLLADFYTDAPLWYEHGMDLDYGWHPVGKRHAVQIFGFGVWVEHMLFTDHPLFERTLKEITDGLLSYSSDSIAHYVEQGVNLANGELRVWPLAGWSLTASPAEPGLGPVTLAGLEATIREVVDAPVKRYPLDEGRAVVTVTACKSVIQPPVIDIPADSDGPDNSEAREAQGENDPLDEGEQPVQDGDVAPVGDAAATNEPPSTEIQEDDEGENLMDPQTLAMLAEFLGVEATPEAVAAALQDLIALLQAPADGAQQSVLPDAGPLRSALDLDDDSDDDAVIERLTGMLAQLEASDPEPQGARTYNFAALRAARRRYDALADRTPAGPPAPYYVPQDNDYDDTPLQRGNGRTHAVSPARSRSLYAPNVNTGRANPPGLGDAIMAGLGYRPVGYRGNIRDIRSRLFQTDRAARADSGDGPSGAFVLNREISANILEPLTSKLVLFEAGAFRMPMDGIDSITLRKMTSGPAAYWAAEHTSFDGDDAKWATATLTLKELRAPTSWPNRWLRNLAPGVENMIRDQMVKAMHLKMENGALFGSGGVPADGISTGTEPLGVRWTPGVTITALDPAHVLEMNDLKDAQAALEDADVEESDTWGWISHPRTFRHFEFMRDENGRPILRESWANGVRERTLVDFDYHKTTAVPKNLGAENNESVLFFGDWENLVVGMGMDVELVVSEHVDIKQNATFVMAVAYVDTVVGYPEAFHIHTGVLG